MGKNITKLKKADKKSRYFVSYIFLKERFYNFLWKIFIEIKGGFCKMGKLDGIVQGVCSLGMATITAIEGIGIYAILQYCSKPEEIVIGTVGLGTGMIVSGACATLFGKDAIERIRDY